VCFESKDSTTQRYNVSKLRIWEHFSECMCTPVIPALGRWRQESVEFELFLCYTANPRLHSETFSPIKATQKQGNKQTKKKQNQKEEQ
jgi:hypothetical protein